MCLDRRIDMSGSWSYNPAGSEVNASASSPESNKREKSIGNVRQKIPVIGETRLEVIDFFHLWLVTVT